MKILVGIPVIYSPIYVRECIKHIGCQDAKLLFVDNNAVDEIKQLIASYDKIVNPKNVYVNPAWNQLIDVYLKSEYDLLIIMNSDLYVKQDVIEKIKALDIDGDKIIPCLNLVSTFDDRSREVTVVEGGVAGVFITLTKTMARAVYPIPESLRLWYGDNWIYRKLQKLGYKLTIYSDIQAKHGWSRSVSELPEAHDIIAKDGIEWKALEPLI